MEWFEDGMEWFEDEVFADIDVHGNGGHGRTKAQETVAMQVDISKTGKHTYSLQIFIACTRYIYIYIY